MGRDETLDFADVFPGKYFDADAGILVSDRNGSFLGREDTSTLDVHQKFMKKSGM